MSNNHSKVENCEAGKTTTAYTPDYVKAQAVVITDLIKKGEVKTLLDKKNILTTMRELYNGYKPDDELKVALDDARAEVLTACILDEDFDLDNDDLWYALINIIEVCRQVTGRK